MRKHLTRFECVWAWSPSRKYWGIVFGVDYSCWNPRGPHYSGVSTLSIHLALLTFRWVFVECVTINDILTLEEKKKYEEVV